MKLTLHIWRQKGPSAPGGLVTYPMSDVSPDMSFLEMLDVLNEKLIGEGQEPVHFDHDCREGICGTCGLVINGVAHGGHHTTTCQLHMRSFRDGDSITIEPWRATPFPVIKDLVVDRSAFDRIIAAGGFITVRSGSAPEANSIPVPKTNADLAFDAATCIGCGACVAGCPNASASLFTAAKVVHLALLPHGQPERLSRVQKMVAQMEAEGFGTCSNHRECEAVCPKGISIDFIARMNRDFVKATVAGFKQTRPEKGD
jgi:succinate dehydrogenase / fumarate reductase iron-sulfur subunit